MICIPSFTKFGGDVEGIVTFYARNLKGCNVGITDGEKYELRK
jgi:hypothetical protein